CFFCACFSLVEIMSADVWVIVQAHGLSPHGLPLLLAEVVLAVEVSWSDEDDSVEVGMCQVIIGSVHFKPPGCPNAWPVLHLGHAAESFVQSGGPLPKVFQRTVLDGEEDLDEPISGIGLYDRLCGNLRTALCPASTTMRADRTEGEVAEHAVLQPELSG